MCLKIDAYSTPSGRKPALEFLADQSGEAIFRIKKSMDFLKKNGLAFCVDNRSVKPITTSKPSFYELRVRADNCWFRFPFVIKGRTVYLLDGFKKKTNRIEKRFFDLARKRANEILD